DSIVLDFGNRSGALANVAVLADAHGVIVGHVERNTAGVVAAGVRRGRPDTDVLVHEHFNQRVSNRRAARRSGHGAGDVGLWTAFLDGGLDGVIGIDLAPAGGIVRVVAGARRRRAV